MGYALQQNHTQDVVPCPSHIKYIGCKWIYSVKFKSNGSLYRYQVRLVIMGNRQDYGIDYDETFSLFAKMTTVCILLLLVASSPGLYSRWM